MTDVSRETFRLRTRMMVDIDVEIVFDIPSGVVLRAIPGTAALLEPDDLTFEAERKLAEHYIQKNGYVADLPAGHVFWLGRAHTHLLRKQEAAL